MLAVQQAFGNCPKYIQARKIEIAPLSAVPVTPVRVTSDKNPLDARSLELVSRSDTFFLATSSGSKEPTHPATSLGCDMSHRGGPVGFVEVQEHPAARASKSYHTLRWGDYVGNNMFNSLGNIALYPRAGMLFIDWETGDTLQVTGPVEILYDEHSLPGAERTLELTVHAWVFTHRGLPLACPAPLIESSPYNPASASAADASSVVNQPIAVECIATYEESSTVVSFEFALPPALQKRLADSPVLPGQYATFDFPLRGGQSLTRTWTISSDPEYIAGRSSFMISVKRVGQVTEYMHDRVAPGVKLTLKAIAGSFTPDYENLRETNQGVLLIAAGIGITPIKAMFRGFLERNIPITLLYTVREWSETVFRRDFEGLAEQYPDRKCRLYLTATRERSSPTTSRKSGRGGDTTRTARNGVFAERTGRIDADMIHAAVPDLRNVSVFLCGPEPFMRDISDALLGPLRFPYPERIFSESFSY
jgi:ferredoxin-NADP reductase